MTAWEQLLYTSVAETQKEADRRFVAWLNRPDGPGFVVYANATLPPVTATETKRSIEVAT
jgi:ABC-type glycerol-3-phosphate transport system substrate-binding protein